jgi:hypothetical protein
MHDVLQRYFALSVGKTHIGELSPIPLQGVVGTKVTGARMLFCGTSVYRQADGVAWKTRIDWSRVQNETIFILYESQDGRKFRTHVAAVDST